MVLPLGLILASVAASATSGAGSSLVVEPCDLLVKDLARLARTYRLETAPIVKNETFDAWFGRPVARFESTRLTNAEKEKLWIEFVKAMAPYGKPYGPDCGYALMSYAGEGIKPPYVGSGCSGGREYYYILEETSGSVHTVVLKLHWRAETR